MVGRFDEALKRAFGILQRKGDYCYFYGLKNQVCSDAAMDWLIQNEKDYFGKYTEDALKYIKDFSRGKVGMDCSGFVSYCFGVSYPSQYLIDSCVHVTTPKNGPAGSILWKPGHVGIDIGYGYFLHFPVEGKSCEIGKISEYDWQKSGQLSGVSYKGASAL